MNAPANDPKPDESPKDERPDWLLRMDEELAAQPPAPAVPPPRLVQRPPPDPRPATPNVAPPTPRIAGSATPPARPTPKLVPEPPRPAPRPVKEPQRPASAGAGAQERLAGISDAKPMRPLTPPAPVEGLIRHETPSVEPENNVIGNSPPASLEVPTRKLGPRDAFSARTPRAGRADDPEREDGEEEATPRTWKAAASSVPHLKVVRSASAPPSSAAGAARGSADDSAELPFLEPVPGSRAAHPVYDSSTPAPPEIDPEIVHELTAAPASPLAAMPRWGWIAIAGLGLAAIAATALLWPHQHYDSVHQIRAHAAAMDGRAVHVAGRVGDVFEVGNGYAFYLIQGRDTIVVYSTQQVPVERHRITLFGTVSTGYLDGVARPAIFETAKP